MATGWRTIDGKKYYFRKKGGKMVTGWKTLSGKTYYFKVRAVRKLDNGNYYSAYSAIKAVKVK